MREATDFRTEGSIASRSATRIRVMARLGSCSSSGFLDRNDLNGQFLSMPDDADRHDPANSLPGEDSIQIIHPGHRLAPKCDDDIALSQAGVRCGAIGFRRADPHRRLLGQSKMHDETARKRNRLYADPDKSA